MGAMCPNLVELRSSIHPSKASESCVARRQPGDSHVTAMEAIKDEFGLRMSATMTPGLLKVMFAAIACRKIRMQQRLLGLGTAQGQN